MVCSASVGAGYIYSRWFFGADLNLLDVWIGLVLMQGSRALTFSIRHWLDPNGPLAITGLPAKGEAWSGEKGKAEDDLLVVDGGEGRGKGGEGGV